MVDFARAWTIVGDIVSVPESLDFLPYRGCVRVSIDVFSIGHTTISFFGELYKKLLFRKLSPIPVQFFFDSRLIYPT